MFKNEYSNQIKHFEYDGFFLIKTYTQPSD